MLTPSQDSKRSRQVRYSLLIDLANLRDGEKAILWLQRKHRSIDPESAQDLIELRDELRVIWSAPTDDADQILDKWLGWRPSREFLEFSYALRGLREPGKGAAISLSADQRSSLQAYLSQSEAEHLLGFMAFRCSIQARGLVPNYDKLRSNLIQGVFEHWHHFKVCSSVECLTPYFIAARSDQTVCNAGACKAEKQRAHARKWWNENRAKRVETKTPKGKLKNGPHKAR